MGKYFEELNLGDKFETHGRTVTEADLAAFNGLTWNTEPLHNDREWVKKNTDFRDRVFPGLCTMAMVAGLEIQTGVLVPTGYALLGIEDVKFLAPVYPGDTIHSIFEVMNKRESHSRPDSGIVSVKHSVRNQEDKVVAEFTRTYLVYRKPK